VVVVVVEVPVSVVVVVPVSDVEVVCVNVDVVVDSDVLDAVSVSTTASPQASRENIKRLTE
jgi:hypothetical protein